jgi:methylated-DNA-[protein]-cysteine S-methyltransferase
MALLFTLFETPLGRCGVVFSERGIAGVQLPERTLRECRARIRERFPKASEAAPSKEAQQAIDGIVALLRGEASDLSAIDLDMSDVPPFHRRVYEAARKITPGATLSYGEVAAQVGSPGAARAVGQALGRNPFAVIVPCHRVLAAQGKIGGFTATGGVDTKKQMLAIETAHAQPAPDTQDHGFAYDPKAAVKHLRQADNALKRIIDAVGAPSRSPVTGRKARSTRSPKPSFTNS